MMEVVFSASVTGLATTIAGFRDGLEGPSAVNVHGNAREKCMRRGVHCCRGCAVGGACEQRRENGVRGGVKCVISDSAE
jgi:hypothetical protein